MIISLFLGFSESSNLSGIFALQFGRFVYKIVERHKAFFQCAHTLFGRAVRFLQTLDTKAELRLLLKDEVHLLLTLFVRHLLIFTFSENLV